MRVIPVMDLMNGQVVRAVAGNRSEYRPIESRIASSPTPNDVAWAFVEQFAFKTAYVADLDAILFGRLNPETWLYIADAGLSLWLDAGIRNGASIAELLDQTTRRSGGFLPRLVVGLESLASLDDLTTILELYENPIFSLDLKGGIPHVSATELESLAPLEIASLVNSIGIQDLIILDLADVGTSGGTRTLDLCRQLRQTCNFRELIAGGGVRGIADITALAEAGCSGVLVASALHDGHLTPADLSRLTTDN
jgi:phosphoribosylformimino-5-aminoimidazole carboxamide ribotide isomerase